MVCTQGTGDREQNKLTNIDAVAKPPRTERRTKNGSTAPSATRGRGFGSSRVRWKGGASK